MNKTYKRYMESRPYINKSAVARYYEDMDIEVIEKYKKEHKELFDVVSDDDLQSFIDEASKGILKILDDTLKDK